MDYDDERPSTDHERALYYGEFGIDDEFEQPEQHIIDAAIHDDHADFYDYDYDDPDDVLDDRLY